MRATGSGAGCGPSWPHCQGVLVPALEGATRIEFIHRLASGLALVLVGLLALQVWRQLAIGHPARRGAVLAVGAIVGEALIGAFIVLFEWVGTNASVARAISVPLHLANTFLLLGALTFTLRAISGSTPQRPPPVFWWVAAGWIVVGATGAVTALADTLLPSSSVSASISAAASASEHFLARLRVAHPIVAVVVSLWAARIAGAQWETSKTARVVVGFVSLQLLVGALNVLLHAPIWLQLVHLAVADGLWIAWVWLGLGVKQPVHT